MPQSLPAEAKDWRTLYEKGREGERGTEVASIEKKLQRALRIESWKICPLRNCPILFNFDLKNHRYYSKFLGCRDPRWKHEYLDSGQSWLMTDEEEEVYESDKHI